MKKEAQTHQTLNSDPGDLAAFREMAISEGTPQTDETSVTQDPQCQHQRANTCIRGGPEAYEPGLPTGAAGCQVLSSALPSCYARWAEQYASGRLDTILFFDQPSVWLLPALSGHCGHLSDGGV